MYIRFGQIEVLTAIGISVTKWCIIPKASTTPVHDNTIFFSQTVIRFIRSSSTSPPVDECSPLLSVSPTPISICKLKASNPSRLTTSQIGKKIIFSLALGSCKVSCCDWRAPWVRVSWGDPLTLHVCLGPRIGTRNELETSAVVCVESPSRLTDLKKIFLAVKR